MPLCNYSTAELLPHKLSREEVEDPYIVIHQLFDYAHLPQIKEQLWDWLKITVAGTWHKQKQTDRTNMLYFYEKMEKIVEACHLIHQQLHSQKQD